MAFWATPGIPRGFHKKITVSGPKYHMKAVIQINIMDMESSHGTFLVGSSSHVLYLQIESQLLWA